MSKGKPGYGYGGAPPSQRRKKKSGRRVVAKVGEVKKLKR